MWDEAFLKRTIDEWQPLSKEPLTLADAQEICDNMVGLFQVLVRIERRIQQPAAAVEGSNNG